MRVSGFSLIESTVAVGLIISALLVFGVFISAISIRKATSFKSTATIIASDTIENLRTMPFDSLPASGTIVNSELSSLPGGEGLFTVAEYGGDAELKQITATITWIFGGEQKNFSEQTLVAKDAF